MMLFLAWIGFMPTVPRWIVDRRGWNVWTMLGYLERFLGLRDPYPYVWFLLCSLDGACERVVSCLRSPSAIGEKIQMRSHLLMTSLYYRSLQMFFLQSSLVDLHLEQWISILILCQERSQFQEHHTGWLLMSLMSWRFSWKKFLRRGIFDLVCHRGVHQWSSLRRRTDH